MKEATPPKRQSTIRKPDSQGAIVHKYDHGGADDPSPVKIPDDCVITGETDDPPGTDDQLSAKSVDKSASPWYEEQPDGSYVFTGFP